MEEVREQLREALRKTDEALLDTEDDAKLEEAIDAIEKAIITYCRWIIHGNETDDALLFVGNLIWKIVR